MQVRVKQTPIAGHMQHCSGGRAASPAVCAVSPMIETPTLVS
jgi:hypothetical protein